MTAPVAISAATTIVSRRPAAGELVTSALPAISGRIARHGRFAVDAASVRVAIDDVDETPRTQRSGASFGFVPETPLAPGDHAVDVNGLDRAGRPFEERWSFRVRPDAAFGPLASRTGVDLGAAFALAGPYGGTFGDVAHFSLVAPPGGSGAISICGYAPAYPLLYDEMRGRYLASVPLPRDVYAPACYVGGTFADASGTLRTFALTSPIPIDTTR